MEGMEVVPTGSGDREIEHEMVSFVIHHLGDVWRR
jgi:hypothetical protein